MGFEQECQQKMVVKLLRVEEPGEEVSLAHNIGLMPLKILTIKKRIEFLHVKLKGTTYISKSLIVQKIFDEKLNNYLKVGYIATKKLGNAVQRNRAKRLMRVLVKKNLHKYGNVNFCYDGFMYNGINTFFVFPFI